jgi:hypothetical protein
MVGGVDYEIGVVEMSQTGLPLRREREGQAPVCKARGRRENVCGVFRGKTRAGSVNEPSGCS